MSDFSGYIGDDRTHYATGDVGFLVKLHNHRRNFTRHELRQHPAREAGTLVPVLDGEVAGGDTTVTAYGVWLVVETTKNGRGKVVKLQGEERTKALEQLGYPELA